MKKLFLLLIFVCDNIMSQPADINFKEEITIETVNVSAQEVITFTLIAIGTTWANDKITYDYQVVNETTYGNVNYNNHYGFRIFSELADPYEPFAHGLYKFTSTESDNYIIFDFRDCQFKNHSGFPNYNTDFRIKYDALTNDYYYMDNNEVTYTYIPTGSVIRIWEIKKGNPTT